MYIDGRQLNDVIFDHSLIITEINFTNTYFTLYINAIAVECQYLNKMNTEPISAVKFCCVTLQEHLPDGH